ncbi:MAG: hypothetical protein AB7I96_10160 [Candidatus Dadabacteria bacterium]
MRRKGLIYGMLIVLGLAAMASYMFNYQAAEDAELTGEVQQAEQDASGSGDSGGQTAGLEDEIARTKHLQEERKRIMDEMVSGGIAERIENPAGEPFVYVMEPFYRLTKSEQSSLLNVIWSYYITEDRNANVVTVYDNATGQEIGTYSQAGMKIGEE